MKKNYKALRIFHYERTSKSNDTWAQYLYKDDKGER